MVAKGPLQIGITGGIGSGKSLICRVFSLLGVPIFEADIRARWLMNHHEGLRQQIREHFGDQSYLPDGSLNRRYLATEVFQHHDQVARLNALVHPRVADDYAAWVLAHARSSYLLKEAALLFEANSYRMLHYTITVYAPLEIRIHRIQQRDPHRTQQEIEGIIQKQLPEEERQAKADFVLHNDDARMVLPQILSLHQRFEKEGKSRLGE